MEEPWAFWWIYQISIVMYSKKWKELVEVWKRNSQKIELKIKQVGTVFGKVGK